MAQHRAALVSNVERIHPSRLRHGFLPCHILRESRVALKVCMHKAFEHFPHADASRPSRELLHREAIFNRLMAVCYSIQ